MRHFWLLAMIMTCFNAAVFWRRAQPEIQKQPQLAKGYRTLIRGFLIYGNVPWIVMGIGVLFGGLRSVSDFVSPRNGPFVLAWYLSVVVIWVLAIVWIFFMRGAEMLSEHPGLLNVPSQSPGAIKFFVLVCIAGGAIALTMVFLEQIPAIR